MVVGAAAVLAGLTWYALATDWRLLLWAEVLLVPLTVAAVVAALVGRGGPAVAAGLVAVSTHAETWLASLQGTLEAAILDADLAGLVAWPATGTTAAETLIVLGGGATVAAGVRLATARARRRGSRHHGPGNLGAPERVG